MDPSLFDKSVLIVAHPDDEALFFSSILTKVDRIIFTYLKCPSRPLWTEGRRKSLKKYPLSNINCIELEESETLHGIDWRNPVVTDYGLEISKKNISDTAYKQNFSYLTQYFKDNLTGFRNIFTHNPWGEYGHAEHIQINRVLNQLKVNMHFKLWYSNYCSNKSFGLMLEYISGFTNDYSTFPTDKPLTQKLKALYQQHDCWTWYNDWVNFNEESFILDRNQYDSQKDYGHIFPLNMIKLEKKYCDGIISKPRFFNSLVSMGKKSLKKIRS